MRGVLLRGLLQSLQSDLSSSRAFSRSADDGRESLRNEVEDAEGLVQEKSDMNASQDIARDASRILLDRPDN